MTSYVQGHEMLVPMYMRSYSINKDALSLFCVCDHRMF